MVGSGASGNNDLRGSLDVNSDEVVVIWVSDASNLSLSLGGEGDFSFNSVEGSLDDIMNGDLSILEELDKSNFSAVSNSLVESFVAHFNSGIIVEED